MKQLPAAAVFVLVCLVGSAALAELPQGQNPYIFGMHDVPDASAFTHDGCVRGWVTDLRYIGHSGTCDQIIDYEQMANDGWGIIMRLDDGGAPALPPNPADFDAFAQTFADCVRKSKGISVWVVGNEPNLHWGHPEDRTFYPSEYGDIYYKVVQAVDALPDGDQHEILFGAMAPWAALPPWGDWDDGLAAAIDHVRAQPGGYIDGVAIHAYTRNRYEPAAITSDDWFPGREGKWRQHFRGYRDTTEMLAARNILDIPLYITESGNACDPPCDPYPRVNNGYWTAMFSEINDWNQNNPQQAIRAVTPYRWTQNDDGSGRDFCIGCRSEHLDDIRNAVSHDWRWTDQGCGGGGEPDPPGEDAGAEPDAGPAEDAGCIPDCTGKLCGDDGCGGRCGECSEGLVCTAQGSCISEGSSDDAGGEDVAELDATTSTDTSTPDDAADDPSASTKTTTMSGSCQCGSTRRPTTPAGLLAFAFVAGVAWRRRLGTSIQV